MGLICSLFLVWLGGRTFGIESEIITYVILLWYFSMLFRPAPYLLTPESAIKSPIPLLVRGFSPYLISYLLIVGPSIYHCALSHVCISLDFLTPWILEGFATNLMHSVTLAFSFSLHDASYFPPSLPSPFFSLFRFYVYFSTHVDTFSDL